MRYLSLFIFLLLAPSWAWSQWNPQIRSGRPGQSIGPFTLGAKAIQFQQGLQINSFKLRNGVAQSIWVNNNVVRLGLSRNFEVSGVWDWRSEPLNLLTDSGRIQGMSNAQVGFRYHLLDGKGAVPNLAIQARALLPQAKGPGAHENWGTQFILVAGMPLNQMLGLTGNYVLKWAGDNTAAQSQYILNLSASLSESVSAFVELYGQTHAPFTVWIDGGFAWIVSPDFQLDLYGGWQGTEGRKDWFMETGISWRINWRNETHPLTDR